MSGDGMTEEQLHDHPDYVTLEQVLEDILKATAGLNEAQVAQFISRSIDDEALTHFANHRAAQVAFVCVPPPIVQMFHGAFSTAWYDGFVLGMKYQKVRADQIAATVIPDVIPDGMA